MGFIVLFSNNERILSVYILKFNLVKRRLHIAIKYVNIALKTNNVYAKY